MEKIKGTTLENKIVDMFGGTLKGLIIEIPSTYARKILEEFPRARIDARGFIEEVPVTFKKILFEEISNKGKFDSEVLDNVLKNVTKIKLLVEKEEEYLPPPEI